MGVDRNTLPPFTHYVPSIPLPLGLQISYHGLPLLFSHPTLPPSFPFPMLHMYSKNLGPNLPFHTYDPTKMLANGHGTFSFTLPQTHSLLSFASYPSLPLLLSLPFVSGMVKV